MDPPTRRPSLGTGRSRLRGRREDPPLTDREAAALLRELRGTPRLAAALVHGAGVRLEECLRLRLGEVDLAAAELAVRRSRNGRIRRVPFPRRLKPAVLGRMRAVRELHRRDLRLGAGWVPAPVPRRAGSPELRRDRGAQHLFPAPRPPVAGPGGRPVRRRLPAARVRRALRTAARRAGLDRPVGCRALRRACAARLHRLGYDPDVVRERTGVAPGTAAGPAVRRRCAGNGRDRG